MIKKTYVSLSRCFVLLFLVIGCTEKPSELFRVGTNVWPGYEPLYLARSLGYLDDLSVRLVEYSNATDVIRAFRNNAIEAAALTLDEVLLLAQDGLEPRVVLIMDISAGGDAIIGSSGIENLADVKGKRIGVEASALGAYVLTRALESVDLVPHDVQTVLINVDRHERAFKEGSVDAVITFEPVKTKLIAAGGHEIFTSLQIPGEIVDVLVVRKNYLMNHTSEVRSLIDNWFYALEYLKKNPHDAARRIVQRMHISEDEFLESLKGLHYPDREENRDLIWQKPPQLITSSEKLLSVMLDNHLLRKSIEIEQLFDVPLSFGETSKTQEMSNK